MNDKRDKCKCGRIICWDSEKGGRVICKHCGTEYTVKADDILVYWLEEIIDSSKRWKTDIRY